MDKLNKNQTIVIILCALIGLALSQLQMVSVYSGYLIEPCLVIMLTGLFLNIPTENLKKSFLNLKFSTTSLIINFVFTPLFAFLLGRLCLSSSLPLQIGFFMLMVTPCTDWYLVFTELSKGNTALSTTILPINFVLQVILLPIYLIIFFGSSGNVEISPMLKSIGIVLIIPLIITLIIRNCTPAGIKKSISSWLESLQIVFLGLAIIAMFASEGGLVCDSYTLIVRILIPVVIFFVSIYAVSSFVARKLHFDTADTTSLIFTTMARNSPLALAIAVSAFSDMPLVSLSLVVGPLIELPVLSFVSYLRRRQLKNNL